MGAYDRSEKASCGFPKPETVVLWRCDLNHAHQSEKAAKACMDAREATEGRRKQRREQAGERVATAVQQKNQRAIKAAALRSRGHTFQEIANIFAKEHDYHVSSTRMRQVCALGERLLKGGDLSHTGGLSGRARNVLRDIGIDISKDHLDWPVTLESLRGVPNCGPATQGEIMRWVASKSNPGGYAMHGISKEDVAELRGVGETLASTYFEPNPT